jgi:sortase A
MLKLSFLLFGVAIFIGIIVSEKFPVTHVKYTSVNVASITLQSTPQPMETAQATIPDIPVKLVVHAIDLSEEIIPVRLTSENIVDTPSVHVGWYQNGVMPGNRGNAVLNGHYINTDLGTGVFYKLSQLKQNDEIDIVDNSAHQFRFFVTSVESVAVNDFPITRVYGRTEEQQLNLITCDGSYDMVRHDYTRRTIVYSKLVN